MDNIYRMMTIGAALDEGGVKWWIDHGTLLGIVREGRLLPWDIDIDISILDHDIQTAYAQLQRVQPLLGARIVRTGRNVKIFPYKDNELVLDIGSYSEQKDDVLSKTLIMFPREHAAKGRRVRAFCWRRLRSVERLLARAERWLSKRGNVGARVGVKMLIRLFALITAVRELCGIRKVSHVPRSLVDPLSTVRWMGLELPVPHLVSEYLCFRYGSGWVASERNWTWWRDDHTI